LMALGRVMKTHSGTAGHLSEKHRAARYPAWNSNVLEEPMRRIAVLTGYAASDPEGQTRVGAFQQGLRELRAARFGSMSAGQPLTRLFCGPMRGGPASRARGGLTLDFDWPTLRAITHFLVGGFRHGGVGHRSAPLGSDHRFYNPPSACRLVPWRVRRITGSHLAVAGEIESARPPGSSKRAREEVPRRAIGNYNRGDSCRAQQ
jgi:hypothetical protein